MSLERRLFWSDEVSLAIDEVNAHLRTLANEQVIVFDSVPFLADERGIVREEFSRYLLHLNTVGYAALNKELVRALGSMSR